MMGIYRMTMFTVYCKMAVVVYRKMIEREAVVGCKMRWEVYCRKAVVKMVWSRNFCSASSWKEVRNENCC